MIRSWWYKWWYKVLIFIQFVTWNVVNREQCYNEQSVLYKWCIESCKLIKLN
jgi:hypothetical protein